MAMVRLSLHLFLLLGCFKATADASGFQEPNTDGFFVLQLMEKMNGPNDSFSSSSVCSWPWVTCDPQMQNVLSLVAPGAGLSGAIPDSTVAKLTSLQTLDLSDNAITALPSDFWELGSSLLTLNLSNNLITGPLSNNIGNFGQLRSLDLSNNQFSGSLPPALGSIQGLSHLALAGNQFQGPVPDAIVHGSASAALSFLDLSGNGITGALPDLSQLRALAQLNLSGNRLTGSASGTFNQDSIQVVDLSNNVLQEFNANLSQFPLLKYVNLAFNKFQGLGFPQMTNLSELEYLNLSSTGITGPIPQQLTQLLSLKTLDLSRNFISGRVPDLSSVVGLRVVDLSVNNLTGEIPVALLSKLHSMQRFNFSSNNLTFCASGFSPAVIIADFAGSRNECPLAVDPGQVRQEGQKMKRLKLGLAVVLSVLFFVLVLLCLVLASKRRRKGSEGVAVVKQVSFKEEASATSAGAASTGPFAFQTDSTTWVADVRNPATVPVIVFKKPLMGCTFADLLSATSNFDRGALVAEGRFGPVYRGILPGGIQVAVKVLVHGLAITDGDAVKELERLGRISHPNLVPLTGYCFAGGQCIAIYDYMEHGNLHHLLHDLPLGMQVTEDWSTDTWDQDGRSYDADGIITPEGTATWRFRHKIALGTARALAFLHHGCIPQVIHRDVKASNIYFDASMEPRLADSGLSVIAGTRSSEDGLSCQSLWYAPPVDSSCWSVGASNDVYSFGVVLFELITGKKPVGDEYMDDKSAVTTVSLVTWARAMVKRNAGSAVIDPKIRETGPERQMEEALRIAYLCTADSPEKRPAMQQIVGLLKDIEPRSTGTQSSFG